MPNQLTNHIRELLETGSRRIMLSYWRIRWGRLLYVFQGYLYGAFDMVIQFFLPQAFSLTKSVRLKNAPVRPFLTHSIKRVSFDFLLTHHFAHTV